MPITVTSNYKKAAAWLSWIAYLGDDSHPNKQKTCMADALQNKMTADANGPYKLVWGPVAQDGFLTFIAKSTVDGSYAVGCRGTLSDTDPLGFITNIVADAGFFKAEPWFYPKYSRNGTRGWYTWGMQFAFTTVIATKDPISGLTMQKFLQYQGSGIEVMVAGHSLGGALANLVAVYLSDQLAATVSSFTFAAPTVTNDTWGRDIFNFYVKTSYQCVNTSDVVPMAWHINTMYNIQETYNCPGESLYNFEDGIIYWAIAAVIGFLIFEQAEYGDRYYYTPVAGRESFAGKIGARQPYTWPHEAFRQHSLVDSYFPQVGLAAPSEKGECEKNQMGSDRPEGLPGVDPEGLLFKTAKGQKLRISKVEQK